MANELRQHQNFMAGRLSYDLPAASTVVTDGVTTNADATVTSATAAFTAADVGAPISGAGIPVGAYIASINSATSVELSANATATASGVTLTISRHQVIHSAVLAALSVVGTTAHQMVALDPDGLAGAPEVVMVTKHDSSATWAQVTRAQESTSARAHAAGTDWVHGAFATDFGGAWTAYTPTWTSTGTAPVIGNGTIVGAYRLRGKELFVGIHVTFGTTTTFGTGTYSFSLPSGFTSVTGRSQALAGVLFDSSAGIRSPAGGLVQTASTSISRVAVGASGAGISNTIPWTWDDPDEIILSGTIEVA